MLNTVNNNKEYLTWQEIAGEDRSQKYQALLGWPSTSDLISYLPKNLIINCDIDVDYIKQAEKIYDAAMDILKGKFKTTSLRYIKKIAWQNAFFESDRR